MNHSKAESLLILYANNELSEDKSKQIRKHLKSCNNCRIMLKQILYILKVFPATINYIIPPNFHKELKHKISKVKLDVP